LILGAYASGTAGRLSGNLDDIRLFSRDLTSSEVAALYESCRLGYPDLLNRISTSRTFLMNGSAGQTITASGIVTAVAFDSATLSQHVALTGISTGEAIGTAALTLHLAPNGVGSAEAFGTCGFNQTIACTGVVSAEAFGTTTLWQHIATAGISTGEAFGTTLFASGSFKRSRQASMPSRSAASKHLELGG
jgi:hypothetical protein